MPARAGGRFSNCVFEVLHCELILSGYLFSDRAYDLVDSVGVITG